MATPLQEYGGDVSENALAAYQTYQSNPYSNNTTTVTPAAFPAKAPSGYNLGAVLAQATVALTATAAESATAGTDLLDEWLSQYEVTATTGGPVRLQAKTRKGAEEMERLLLQAPNATTSGSPFAQPRATPAAFTGAGSRTDVSYLMVCAGGGQSLQLRFVLQAITTVYAASVTASTSIVLYAIPTLAGYVTATDEIITNSLPAGTSDLAFEYQPSSISATLLSFVGTVASSTGITRIVHETQTGRAVLVDFEDYGTLAAVQYLNPYQTGLYSSVNTVIKMFRQRARSLKVTLGAAVSAGLDLVYVDADSVPTAGPQSTPAQTPTSPATEVTGTVGAGGNVVPTSSAGGVSSNTGPRPGVGSLARGVAMPG